MAQVTKISKVTRNGLYAPLTEDGTIAVDGVVASTYATLLSKTTSEDIVFNGYTLPVFDQASFLHMSVAPLRLVCRMSTSQLSLCQGSYDEEGYNKYVSWAMNLIRWAEEQGTMTVMAAAAFFVPMFASFRLLELAILGAGHPLIWAALAFIAHNRAKIGSTKKVV